jgi:hypothetical protein
MSSDERAARRARLLGTIAVALGVTLPACGGGARSGAKAPSGSASAAQAREVKDVHERAQRDAHCGRD